MNAKSFSDIAHLPVVRQYEEAFRSAMGVPVRLVPPDIPQRRLSLGVLENPFCVLVAASPLGCQWCADAQACAQRAAAKGLGAQQVSCSASLTEVAVPIFVGGRHVATLLSGQVLRREPTERDFAFMTRMLGGESLGSDWKKRARAAYFSTPVVTADRFQALVQMLNFFAAYLADSVGWDAVACPDDEPAAVARAKRFVQARAAEPIDLESVVRHVAVSRFYFCRLFKKATGMTLSEYVSRVRLDNAKKMLLDPSLRISEVGYAAGFASIPRFNAVFKQYVGMAPTDYRATRLSRQPG